MCCDDEYCKKHPLDLAMFEAAYSDFLDSKGCDWLDEVLSDLLRASFAAGYRAAGGIAPKLRPAEWVDEDDDEDDDM